VRRFSGLAPAVCALAALSTAGSATASSPPPEGPALAFRGFSALNPRGVTVNTIGYAASRTHLALRGSRHGVVPNPLSGVAWSKDGSELAFTGSKGNKNGIYMTRADGTGVQFVHGTKGGSDPVLSPDGSEIAFAREGLSGGRLLASTPWVAAVDGHGARRLLGWHKNATYTPGSFSPDGSTLAVTKGEFASDESEIVLIKLGRRRARTLIRRASEPAFSPDGSRLVFVRHSLERQGRLTVTHKDLYTVDADGGKLRRVTHTPWVAETHPSWDPSGERIAFDSFRISRDPFERLFDELLPVGNSIAQINPDGSCRERLISRHDLAIYGAVWRPGPERGAGRIECSLDAVTALGPQGARLAVVKFDLSRFAFELETIDDTGALPLRIAGGGELARPQPEWFTSPTWSPDGSKIVFVGIARGLGGGPHGKRLYISRADGSGLRPLQGTHGADEPVFTPDGTAIAFTRFRNLLKQTADGNGEYVARGASVWLLELADRKLTRITPARRGLYVYGESFSPNGRTLLGSRSAKKGRSWEVVKINLATGKMGVLLHDAEDPAYSPDGSRIAFVRWSPRKQRQRGGPGKSADIFTIKAAGGGLRRLTHGPGNDLFPSWDPSGERLAFVHYRPEVTELDEIGIESALMQVNADGSCAGAVLGSARKVALYGAAWQPGPGRGAGPITC
jgi:Tol biopolymer transport system component